MERDKKGNITRFDPGDKINFSGIKYMLDEDSAANLNLMLKEIGEGTTSGALAQGRFSLMRVGAVPGSSHAYSPLGISHLDLFRQLPVDLTGVKVG